MVQGKNNLEKTRDSFDNDNNDNDDSVMITT